MPNQPLDGDNEALLRALFPDAAPDVVTGAAAVLDHEPALAAALRDIHQRTSSSEPAITDRDDVPWDQAPLPRHWHRCWPQTTLTHPVWPAIHLCACGGVSRGATASIGYGPTWTRRNYRREHTRRLNELSIIPIGLITTAAILYTLITAPVNVYGIIIRAVLTILLVLTGGATGKCLKQSRALTQSNKRLDEAIKQLRLNET